MLVRLSYDRRVALFPSLAASWPISFLGGREKQARVADRRASYAIFSTYVDEETNFYLKRRTPFGDPRAASLRSTRANPFAVLPARVLLLSRRVDVLLIYSSRPSPDTRACYRSPRSPWSKHRAVRSMDGSCPDREIRVEDLDMWRSKSGRERRGGT